MKRELRRGFCALSALVIVFYICGIMTFSPTASAEMFGGFSYAVEDGKASITGFSGSGVVTVPSEIAGYPVTVIGTEAFVANESITEVVIPDSVTFVGNGAFLNCTALNSVTIGDGVTAIGVKSFMSCKSLETVELGNNLKTIGVAAFGLCESLKEIAIPDSVEEIGSNAFQACTSLEKVTGCNGLKNIGIKAFTGCNSLTEIKLGEKIKSIGAGAFIYCSSIEEFSIPDEVELIDDSTFLGCASLKTISLGSCVKTIGRKAFNLCSSLESVKNTENVVNVGAYAFANCESLVDAVLPDSINSIESGTFVGCSTIKNVVIDDNIIKIGSEAFSGCSSLTSLKIGKSVSEIGDGAFSSCISLDAISLDSENKIFKVVDGTLYDKEMTTVLCCPGGKTEYCFPESVTTIGSKSFLGCEKLESLFIPETVTNIGRVTFYGCSSLAEISIPKGISEIGDATFYGCSSLKSITVPGGVTSIGSDVFIDCEELFDLYFEGPRADWEDLSKNAGAPETAFIHCTDDPPLEFTDVKSGAYYANAVMWAIINDVTSGTSKTSFSPEDGCTRGQVVTFLWRAAGSPVPEIENNPFTDVKTDDYYYNAVLWAVEKNITKGTSETKFSPSNVCTRGQIVTFLWRASGEPEPETPENPFEDVTGLDYFSDAVLWAMEKGITKGTANKTFSPSDTCTRGQVVTFLFRSTK